MFIRHSHARKELDYYTRAHQLELAGQTVDVTLGTPLVSFAVQGRLTLDDTYADPRTFASPSAQACTK